MTARYVIRTVDEDWIDVHDEPSRIDDRRAAWEEARRRVRAYPELMTVVICRDTGRILWQSEPDIPRRFRVVAADPASFSHLRPDERAVTRVISAHRRRDDALTAFYDAIEDPTADLLVVLETIDGHPPRIVATSEDFSRAVPA
ncbi:MAG: hypothetical protein OYH76_24600 [Defluviicoccus sp.]|nr:hypothetical protein [Defluviicoccus sp.]MDE0279089.1 hypothetical protein [Defluviicoccus sp.]